MKTIEDAKNFLRGNYAKGCTCPCCGRYVKLYKRALHKGMALDLIRVHKATISRQDEFVHVEEILQVGGKSLSHNFGMFAMWELAEPSPEEVDGKKTAGAWKLTRLGRDFVSGRVKVPKRVHVYNGRVYERSTETVSIREALGSKFDYDKLMSE